MVWIGLAMVDGVHSCQRLVDLVLAGSKLVGNGQGFSV